MIVFIPSKTKGGKTIWLGPYKYPLNQMLDSVGKITELFLMGAYLELEECDEPLAFRVLRELEGPFQIEFRRVIDAYLQAKRILQEIQS
jgi:hypothetical protein